VRGPQRNADLSPIRYRLVDGAHPARLAYVASIFNAATFDPNTGAVDFGNMNAFRQAGGKLIIWHGWADALVPPNSLSIL
jgi:hypothetical protein